MKTEVVETVNKRGQGWTKLASREMEVWTFSTPERALDLNILTRPSRKRERIGYPAPKILSKSIILRNIISKFGRFPTTRKPWTLIS